ncbi:MAG: tetratricopeptide repeat protein [Flavobacteriales bacterium]|nr:tetratricopeptide repeat protein [Flavobacteriales bacterium]
MTFKKTTFLTLALLMSVAVFGQKSKRTSAYNYLDYGELDNAVEAIEPTITHEKTMNEAKTWFYRGMIYQKVYENKIADGKYKDLSEDPLQVSYESMRKCQELDDKGYHTDDVKIYLNVHSVNFFNQGVVSLQNKDVTNSIRQFTNAIDLAKEDFCPAMNDTLKMLSYYYRGWSYDINKEFEKAEIDYIKAAELAIPLKQPEATGSFARLIGMYHTAKNQTKEQEMIDKARKILNDPNAFIIEEANIYLGSGDVEKAVTPLKQAVEADPENYSARFALGSILEQMAKKIDESGQDAEAAKLFDEARGCYKQAVVDIDKALMSADEDEKETMMSAKFDAVYSIGASYFNMGAKMNEAASNIVKQKDYDAAMDKVLSVFRKALPTLEQAYEMQPDDKGVLIALSQLYYKLDADDPSYEKKMEEVSAKLNRK